MSFFTMGKRCCALTTFLVAMVMLGLCIGIPLAAQKEANLTAVTEEAQARSIDSLCQVTSYPSLCSEALAGGNYSSATSVTKLAMQAAITGVDQTRNEILAFDFNEPNPAMEVCSETLAFSKEYTAAALQKLQSLNETLSESTRDEAMDTIKAWMSAAMGFHTTCVEAFSEFSRGGQLVQGIHTDKLFSNALAFVNALEKYGENVNIWKSTMFSFLGDVHIPSIPGFGNRKLLSSEELVAVPGWMDAETEEELLQGNWYDVLVAKDGSGNFDTIQAAVDAHTTNVARLVVYVKAGIYDEQVNVPTTCKFLSIVGDGDATIITGDRNVASMPGMTTFKSATLIIAGEGFLGRSFKVQNTAGSAGQQAVAYRGSADALAFYRVTFDGYQDTLYANAGRHYYRECTILGTVDFIFGNAAAAFQSCTIIAKKTTLLGQQNTYTAHGRTDPHQSTGLSFQNCKFDGTPELISNPALYKTYLGRPWNPYSVCVVMKSELLGHIDPTGWLPWNASTFGLYTSYFAEYQNFGAGATPAARVNWSHQIARAEVAEKYTANSFVQAGVWMRGYDVPLTADL